MSQPTNDQNTTKPCVWVTENGGNSDLSFGFTCPMAWKQPDAFLELNRTFRRGIAIEPGKLPARMHADGNFEDESLQTLPHIFWPSGFLAVSGAFADILQRYNLGQTQLHPVEMEKAFHTGLFPGRYFFLNIAENHKHFLLHESRNYRTTKDTSVNGRVSYFYYTQKDFDLTLADTALGGVDLWTDPKVSGAIFFSDMLAQELQDAGVTKDIALHRCLIA